MMDRLMDFINPAAAKRYLVPVLLFLAASMFIWYGGAHLAISGYTPLGQPDRRFIAIVFIFLFFLYRFFFTETISQGEVKSAPDVPFMQKQLQLVEARVQGAVNFLRHTRVAKDGKKIALNHLPWYLLIGAPGSGKTTMLANSSIRFVLDSGVPHSETCDWWVTRDLVLVDVPGVYVALKGKRKTMTNKLWLSFLGQVKQMRAQRSLNGVVMTFSVSDLMDRQRRTEYLNDLRASVAALKDKFGKELPFYMVITKCDLLPGFMDFFGECSIEELAQAWGVSMPALSINDSLIDTFSNRFDVLIKRLNQQLLLRLHQERNAYSRIYIKDFPLQVERLKEWMLEVIKGLIVKESFCLHGVYLTSGVQQPVNVDQVDPPQTVPGESYQRELEIMHEPARPAQSCFVKQFILHALVPASRHSYTSKLKTNIKRVVYDNRSKS